MNKVLKKKIGLYELYIDFSFLTSIIMWGALYFSNELPHHFLKDYFFVHVLVLGNWHFWSHSKGHETYAKASNELPKFFLFQMISFIGLGFEFQSIGALYLSMVPLLSGLYFYQFRKNMDHDDFNKASILPTIGIFSFLSFNSFYENQFIDNHEILMVCLFLGWAGGLFFWANHLVVLENKNWLLSFLKKKHGTPKRAVPERSKEVKDQYFFHDLINQTHGLNLFLSRKIAKQTGVGFEETLVLQNEIKTLQTLLKDHYGHGHKNLYGHKDIVSFDLVKSSIYHLVTSFLPEHLTETHFVFKGLLDERVPAGERVECRVHFPSFYRILNNLIKNISEEKSSSVEFCFDYQPEGLHVIVKNQIFRLKNKVDLAENLSEIILNENDSNGSRDNGIGLESVASLTESLGGAFHFSIQGEYWVNEIFLPNPSSAGPSENIKKAA